MLTDIKARAAKAKQKPYKLTDREGLYLFITPNGGKVLALRLPAPGGTSDAHHRSVSRQFVGQRP